jgi:PAS domain-containing protein
LASVNSRLSAALARQREQAMLLQASAGGVRDILDELPMAVLGIDPDGLLVYANCRAQAFFRPPDLVLGLPVGPLVTQLLDRLEDVRRGGFETLPEAVQINGEMCTLWSRPLLNEAGQPRGQVLLCLTETQMACHEPV